MKYTATVILASAAAASASGCVEIAGNNYCSPVSHIKYLGLEGGGSYKAVTSMDASGGCNLEDKDYSGSIAPFDEELSVHIRGPTQLKSFAVYTPVSSSSKKREARKPHSKRHGHQHLHKKHQQEEEEKRAVGDTVIATINGEIVSWTNEWSGEAATTTAAAATATAAAADNKFKSSKPPSQTSTATSASSNYVSPGDYERVAYYSAESAEADGVAFMGNYGGQGSGVWDTTWGNSLSYLNAEGTGGAASPNVLNNVLVGDNQEYAIFSDKECAAGDAECGYYRDGAVAHHGFGGADKVFLFEFQMPLSGNTGFNGDMPALWLLNAKIPRTMQYGDCSCWGNDGGCGEVDVFEVLSSGETKCKSTFHFANALGSSDYFDRPTSSYVKVALVFQASTSTASIKVLDSSVDFASSLTGTTVGTFVDEDDDLGLFSAMTFGKK